MAWIRSVRISLSLAFERPCSSNCFSSYLSLTTNCSRHCKNTPKKINLCFWERFVHININSPGTLWIRHVLKNFQITSLKKNSFSSWLNLKTIIQEFLFYFKSTMNFFLSWKIGLIWLLGKILQTDQKIILSMSYVQLNQWSLKKKLKKNKSSYWFPA